MANPSHTVSPSPAELRELAAALKHDLAKYVAWRSANLGDAAWTGALEPLTLQSITADVLATRDAPDAVEAAWEVFARLSAAWPRPWPAELVAVAEAVAVLHGLEVPLRAGDVAAIAAARGRIRAAQSIIRSELAALHRRLVREA